MSTDLYNNLMERKLQAAPLIMTLHTLATMLHPSPSSKGGLQMSDTIQMNDDNKEEIIKVLNLNLVTQPDYHKDFLITDIIEFGKGFEIKTKSCSEVQKSDRSSLINKVFIDCNVSISNIIVV